MKSTNKVVRELMFEHAGEYYRVNEKGQIMNKNVNSPSDTWLFIGVSFNHNKTSIDLTTEDAFKDPKKLIGGIVWDIDHGTTRQWFGRHNGKISRITNAWVQPIKPDKE